MEMRPTFELFVFLFQCISCAVVDDVPPYAHFVVETMSNSMLFLFCRSCPSVLVVNRASGDSKWLPSRFKFAKLADLPFQLLAKTVERSRLGSEGCATEEDRNSAVTRQRDEFRSRLASEQTRSSRRPQRKSTTERPAFRMKQ